MAFGKLRCTIRTAAEKTVCVGRNSDSEQMCRWTRGPGTVAALGMQTVPWVFTDSILGRMKIDASSTRRDL